jgi:hypothetical protein
MICLLALSVHCSIISLSIGKSIGISNTIIRSLGFGIADTFLHEYQYHYWRYFCKVLLTTLTADTLLYNTTTAVIALKLSNSILIENNHKIYRII